jgi:hypothetical protein
VVARFVSGHRSSDAARADHSLQALAADECLHNRGRAALQRRVSVINDGASAPVVASSKKIAKRCRPNVPTGHYGSAATNEPKYNPKYKNITAPLLVHCRVPGRQEDSCSMGRQDREGTA